MGIRDELENDLADWDGKSADAIGMIHEAYRESPRFTTHVVALLRETPLQGGASWLLKREIERGATLGDTQTRAIYEAVSLLEGWESKLHVLQCIPFLPIPADLLDDVAAFVRENLESARPFVRAWAYGALKTLADQDARFEKEAQQRFAKARRGEAPSVLARLRRLGVLER